MSAIDVSTDSFAMRRPRLRRLFAARPDTPEPAHYSFIDALRGIAVLVVIIFHCAYDVPGLWAPLRELFGRGSAGVQLFYVLSAFTLCESFRARAGDNALVGRYLLRRLFRIVPMLWVAIGLYFVVQGSGPNSRAPDGLTALHYVLTALMLHGFSVTALDGVIPGGWSVAIEFQFYLLLPMVFWYASTLKRALGLLGVSVLVSLPSVAILYGGLAPYFPARFAREVHDFAYFSIPNQLPVFLIGVVAYRLLGPDRAILARLEAAVPLRSLAFIALVALMAPIRHSFPGHLGYAVASMLLLYAMATSRVRWLDNPITRFYGKISYSAYLLHFAARMILMRYAAALGLSPLATVAFMEVTVLAATTLCASATQALVEEPGIALGRKVSKLIFARAPVMPRQDPTLHVTGLEAAT